jgi:hypothetical protein
MAYQPKSDAPDQAWLAPIDLLRSLIDDSYPEWVDYQYWLQDTVPLEAVDVNDFCVAGPPAVSQLTVADMLDGSYLEKLVACARLVAFNNFCEEI